jgi:MFS family permease
MSNPHESKGWQVVIAGTGINLALGVLYAWSIFKEAIVGSIKAGGPGAFQWDLTSVGTPYAVCCLTFAFAMIIAGKAQDKIGPAKTALIGGLLVGAGFVLLGFTTSFVGWVVGFGILAGAGFGFGYSAATPPAVKWFSSAKTGLVAGIVVAGFGLAPVYIAPLAKFLLHTYGIQNSMLILGIGFLAVVCGLSFLLVNPPKGYVPREVLRGYYPALDAEKKKKEENNATVSEVLRSPKFYVLWFCFFIGAGAGLMVIGSVAGMAKQSMGEMAFVAVAVAALGNAAGRIVAGVLSDRIGRRATLFIMLAFQASLMFAAIPITSKPNPVTLVLLATFMAFNYGSNLALFPSFAKDYWGLKNYGLNYGALFTAWGLGGFVLVQAADKIKAMPNGNNNSFVAAGVLLVCGAALSIFLADKKKVTEGEAEQSRWKEFWAEFMLGAKVFIGFEEAQIRPVPFKQ